MSPVHIQQTDNTGRGTILEDTLETDSDRVKSTETSTTTATVADTVEIHECNGTSDYVVTLPTHEADKVVTISNKNTGVATLTPTSGTIFGSSTELLYQYESFVIKSDGTNWELAG